MDWRGWCGPPLPATLLMAAAAAAAVVMRLRGCATLVLEYAVPFFAAAGIAVAGKRWRATAGVQLCPVPETAAAPCCIPMLATCLPYGPGGCCALLHSNAGNALPADSLVNDTVLVNDTAIAGSIFSRVLDPIYIVLRCMHWRAGGTVFASAGTILCDTLAATLQSLRLLHQTHLSRSNASA